MVLNAISMAMSIQDVVMALKFGIEPVHLSAGSWYVAESQTSALERKERCSFALSRSFGGYRWLARQRELYLAFDFGIMKNEIHG
jgi:hypothetical protein